MMRTHPRRRVQRYAAGTKVMNGSRAPATDICAASQMIATMVNWWLLRASVKSRRLMSDFEILLPLPPPQAIELKAA